MGNLSIRTLLLGVLLYTYVKSNGVGGGSQKSLSKDLSRSSKLDNFTSDINADSEKGKISGDNRPLYSLWGNIKKLMFCTQVEFD